MIRLIKTRQDEPPREDGLRVVYRADEAGRLAGTETDAAPKVVLVASRHCGFSRAALEAIAADGETSALMASHGLVLAGPDEDVTSPWHREWARANPGLALGSVALKSRWPGVSFAETPVVFLVDGEDARPVLIGWRAEESAENVAALRRALEEVARAEAP